ncbi:Ubinuclein-2 [Gossypium arboreum]|uniref:Ubinuclein-2 n=1 Tax=Gossypium arboreum TaxID=29729 RepID=A0A0B0NME5_GOSAR|nr:Ubinuclein-2 [Gossypium arboreum]
MIIPYHLFDIIFGLPVELLGILKDTGGKSHTPSKMPMPYPRYGLTRYLISILCPRHGLTRNHIPMPMPYPRYGLTWAHLYRCQCHVPDMVLHRITHNPNVMTFVS